MKDILLVAAEDPSLKSEIASAAKIEMVKCHFVSRGEHLTQMVKNWDPFLLIVDLSSDDAEWMFRHIGEIKMEKHDFPVIGIVSKTQEAPKMRAQAAGCDLVLPKAVFLDKIPKLLQRFLH